MSESPWLIDEAIPLDQASTEALESVLGSRSMRGGLAVLDAPTLAVSLRELMIHDNRKWFGEAEVRLDALVVHGHGAVGEPESFYTPQTFRFERIGDEDPLPIGEAGLLFFYGRPLHFLDLFVTASRSTEDTDDLSTYLAEGVSDPSLQDAFGQLASLVAAPQVAAVNAAIQAATRLGTFAYQVLRRVTGSTVGLYHTTYLEVRDGFGLGRHPEQGTHRVKTCRSPTRSRWRRSERNDMAAFPYLDFDLLVERTGDRYRARVLSSPGGEASTDFTSLQQRTATDLRPEGDQPRVEAPGSTDRVA